MSSRGGIGKMISEEMRGLMKVRGSYFEFLKHCKIVDAPTIGNPGGVIGLELWSHLEKTAAHFISKRLIVILKARQIGISWLEASYALWFALGREGANNLLFSKGEAEAIELLGKCRRIYNNLPEWMQLKLGTASATELTFPTMSSSIKAFAATETDGISYTASVVICDEWDEHPYAEEQYMAMKPTRDAGGQFIGSFTVNKMKPNTLAKAIFTDAIEGKNDFVPLFYPWSVRPGRTEGWYEETKRNIPQRELSRLTPELYMEQNYPNSIEEALRPPRSLLVFEVEVLERMMKQTCRSIETDDVRLDPRTCHIYEDYCIGERYIGASDVSHGIGRDYAVTVIMNVRSGAVVADIMSNTIKPEEFALHSVKLLQHYNSPTWYPEDNDWGQVVISAAKRLEYKRFGYQDSKKAKEGFHFSDSSRDMLWGELIPAVNKKQITIYNREGLKQFYQIIRNVEKNGRVEAQIGSNDDYPIAVGIAWLKREADLAPVWKPHPIASLHFPSPGRHPLVAR